MLRHMQTITLSTKNLKCITKTCLPLLVDDHELGRVLAASMPLVLIRAQQTLHPLLDAHDIFISVVTSVSKLNHHHVKAEAVVRILMDVLIHLDQTERVFQTLGERCQLEEVVVVGLRDGKMGVGLVLGFFFLV
jgi:hypothetical protein